MYSVQQQLNPKMFNPRADLLYASTKVVHNAENYLN